MSSCPRLVAPPLTASVSASRAVVAAKKQVEANEPNTGDIWRCSNDGALELTSQRPSPGRPPRATRVRISGAIRAAGKMKLLTVRVAQGKISFSSCLGMCGIANLEDSFWPCLQLGVLEEAGLHTKAQVRCARGHHDESCSSGIKHKGAGKGSGTSLPAKLPPARCRKRGMRASFSRRLASVPIRLLTYV